MKMATKSGTRTKTAVKPAKKASAVKPVKKTVKKRTAALSAASVKKLSETEFLALRAALERRPLSELTDAEWRVRNTVTLAEVEVLAARALRLIKASKKLSADRKAWALADVADTLEKARGRGGISKCGASMLKHAHLPPQPLDMETLKAIRAA
jgi:hypothetical protein